MSKEKRVLLAFLVVGPLVYVCAVVLSAIFLLGGISLGFQNFVLGVYSAVILMVQNCGDCITEDLCPGCPGTSFGEFCTTLC